jgi:hypothetical protein
MASDLDFLNDVGVDLASVQTKASFGNVVSDVIFEWLTELTGNDGHLQVALRERDVVSGGGQASDLAGSIAFDVTDKATQLKWVVTMNDYWEYVEYGRKPTIKKGGGPINPMIAAWIKKKGFSPVEWMKRINPTWKMPVKSKHTGSEFDFALRSLTSIITHGIHKNGTTWQQKKFGQTGTNFISRTLKTEVPNLSRRLEITLGRRIEIALVTSVKKLKK